MSFQEALYHPLLYALVGVVILWVLGLSVWFAQSSYRYALKLGFTKTQLKKVITSSAITSVVPSLAVVLGLFALAGVLGNAWPWLRLSVIGSVTYELLAADLTATSMGVGFSELSSIGLSGLINVMLVMTTGIASGLVILMIFGKKIQTRVRLAAAKTHSFGTVALECFMVALVVTFLPAFWTLSWVHFLVFLTSITITISLGLLMQRFNIKWLKDFILAFALLGGMASSLLWHTILEVLR